MTDIRHAKHMLGRELRAVEGFVGLGVGRDGIRVYASSDDAPVVSTLRDRWGDTYEGFPVAVVVSQGFRAQVVSRSHRAAGGRALSH